MSACNSVVCVARNISIDLTLFGIELHPSIFLHGVFVFLSYFLMREGFVGPCLYLVSEELLKFLL
jgi:hypothetical protein